MPTEHCAHPLTVEAFERLILGKLYFDRDGLLVAECDGQVVGLAHGGFGPDEEQTDLDHTFGTISVVVVHPAHRRRGLGCRLLQAVEQYLHGRGSTTIYAMGMWPVCPFYVGLYGGSEMAGVLSSNAPTIALLRRCAYEPVADCVVMRRGMDQAPCVSDIRFRALRRQYQVEISVDTTDRTWWWQQVYGCFEGERIMLRDMQTRRVVASAYYWDMAEFARGGQGPMVGVIDVQVDESHRRQGVGKYLMAQLLSRLEGYYVSTVEVLTMQANQAAQGLYSGIGFEAVERGTAFKRKGSIG